jgi:hypothetical protein
VSFLRSEAAQDVLKRKGHLHWPATLLQGARNLSEHELH